MHTPQNDSLNEDDEFFSEINIVPFVDIVLVLLVIFYGDGSYDEQTNLGLKFAKSQKQ